MFFFNKRNKYGFISIFFHWFTFLILLIQIPMGFYLEDLEFSDLKMSVENYHSLFGMLIFYLTLTRLIWKSLNISPNIRNDLSKWQIFISELNHWLLYILLLTISISGILKKLFSGESINFFVTSVSSDDFNFAAVELAENIHSISAILILALITLHILAVIYHHVFLKDQILKKII